MKRKEKNLISVEAILLLLEDIEDILLLFEDILLLSALLYTGASQ